jgi:hypothetical protein
MEATRIAAGEIVNAINCAITENDFRNVFKLFDDLYNLPLKLVRCIVFSLSHLSYDKAHIREFKLIRFVKAIEDQHADKMGIRIKVRLFLTLCV